MTTTWLIGEWPLLHWTNAPPEGMLRIEWANALLLLLLSFAVAQFAAGVLSWMSGVKRPTLVFGTAVLAAAVVALAASGWTSRKIWGYYFRRPGVDRRVVSATALRSRTPVIAGVVEDGRHVLKIDRGEPLDPRLALSSCDRDPYYCLDERVLQHLHKGGLLDPLAPGMSDAELDPVLARLVATGCLVEAESGYPDKLQLRGTAFQLTGEGGTEYLLVAVHGLQVSNDHYPYYEFLFSERGPGDLELLSVHQFFFDIAGMEGFEWYVFWFGYTLTGIAVILPTTAAVLTMRRLILWLRRRRTAVTT